MYIPLLDNNIIIRSIKMNKFNTIIYIVNTFDVYIINDIITQINSILSGNINKNFAIFLFGSLDTNKQLYNQIKLFIDKCGNYLLIKNLNLIVLHFSIDEPSSEIVNNAIHVSMNKYNNLSFKTYKIINYKFPDNLKQEIFTYIIDINNSINDKVSQEKKLIYRGLVLNKDTFRLYKKYLKYKTKYHKLKILNKKLNY